MKAPRELKEGDENPEETRLLHLRRPGDRRCNEVDAEASVCVRLCLFVPVRECVYVRTGAHAGAP